MIIKALNVKTWMVIYMREKKKDCKLEIHFQCKKLEKSKNYSKEVEADR